MGWDLSPGPFAFPRLHVEPPHRCAGTAVETPKSALRGDRFDSLLRGRGVRFRAYTRSHRDDLLRAMNPESIFSSEEYSLLTRHEAFGIQSKADLIRWDLELGNTKKLGALGFLIDYLNAQGLRNIVSFGSGRCVMEYVLRLGLPHDANVVATDFNMEFVRLASTYLDGITAVLFDLTKDDPRDLQEKLKFRFDVAIFFGSTAVLDDDEFVRFFRRLGETGVKVTIDLPAGGFIPLRRVPRALAREALARLRNNYRGKLHGYHRTRGALRRLYHAGGVTLINEFAIEPYDYVAIGRF